MPSLSLWFFDQFLNNLSFYFIVFIFLTVFSRYWISRFNEYEMCETAWEWYMHYLDANCGVMAWMQINSLVKRVWSSLVPHYWGVLRIILDGNRWWCSSPGALGSLTWSCSICYNSVYGLNRSVWKLIVLERNTLNQITVHKLLGCLNFWDEAWWFLSLRVFGLLSSSLLLLLFPQRFGRYVLRHSSGVCRSSKIREGSWVRQTPEEGRWTYRPKRCGNNNNNKDEDNSPKTLKDKEQITWIKNS